MGRLLTLLLSEAIVPRRLYRPTDRSGKFTNLEEKMAYNVTVDVDKCVGCGECVDVCPVEVYQMKDGKSDPVNAEECLGCESCVEVCEGHCITVEEQ